MRWERQKQREQYKPRSMNYNHFPEKRSKVNSSFLKKFGFVAFKN
jgi:hypothetical protein